MRSIPAPYRGRSATNTHSILWITGVTLRSVDEKNAGQHALPGVPLIQLEASAPRSILKVRNARIVVGARRGRVRSICGAPIETSRSVVPGSVSVVPVEPSRSPQMVGIGLRCSRHRSKRNTSARNKDQDFAHDLAPFRCALQPSAAISKFESYAGHSGARALAREPGIHNPRRGYGFRARHLRWRPGMTKPPI
jgi:hypothetical protein